MSSSAELSLHSAIVNHQGRLVVPVEVRRALGIQPGDRVQFVIDQAQVRLVTPRMRAMSLWAQNHGGDAGDSARDTRATRDADRAADDASEARIAAAIATDTRTDDEVTTDVLAGLGL